MAKATNVAEGLIGQEVVVHLGEYTVEHRAGGRVVVLGHLLEVYAPGRVRASAARPRPKDLPSGVSFRDAETLTPICQTAHAVLTQSFGHYLMVTYNGTVPGAPAQEPGDTGASNNDPNANFRTCPRDSGHHVTSQSLGNGQELFQCTGCPLPGLQWIARNGVLISRPASPGPWG